MAKLIGFVVPLVVLVLSIPMDPRQGSPQQHIRLQDGKDPFVSGCLVSGQSGGRVVRACRCCHINLLQPGFVVELSGMAAY